ncbi:hypothetical protein [Legionella genomosp. 1]|uniref:hypothetical protein n=1 Tax=Legionella genomosp. 1 TaxID=1093625 RepID=UPI00105576B1|nr:hypothetical protein [Legionella genomosp. 1]
MAITLKNLESIDQSIQKEFEQWIKSHVPETVKDTDQIKTSQYSILNYPALWSGARLFETRINAAKSKEKPASESIDELIEKSKKANKKDEKALKEILAFEKLFKKQAEYFKEKALIQFVNKTIDDLSIANDDAAKSINQIKDKIRNLFSANALLKLQRRYDCLQTHRQISLLCQELRTFADAKNKDALETIIQLEVLGKRVIDGQYEHAKKMTLTEAIGYDVATATSLIGWVTSFPAAILGLAGIFFPPLLVPAGIIGTISFISYAASIISVANMAHQAFAYGRSPHPRDFWWMVMDVVLAPVNLAGGAIFSSFANLAKPIKHLPNVINIIGDWWNNVFSNILPDVFFVKDSYEDSKKIGATYTARGQLRNSPTASSWKQMGSALSQMESDAASKIRNTKEEIALVKADSKRRPVISEVVQDKEALLKNLKEQLEDTPDFKSIYQALDDYFGLESKLPKSHQYVNTREYREEIYRKSCALVNLLEACNQLTSGNQELAEPQGLINQIAQNARVIEQHLSDTYQKLLSSGPAGETAAHSRDFAFVRLSSTTENLQFAKSHQAGILLWDKGFMGTRTSREAEAVLKAVKAYKELDPDVSRTLRLSALNAIAEQCKNYIDLNKANPKKGRLQYVEKLAETVKNEKAALEEFSAEEPVLVEFKAK